MLRSYLLRAVGVVGVASLPLWVVVEGLSWGQFQEEEGGGGGGAGV